MSSQGGPATPLAWGTALAALRAAARAKAETLGAPTTALEDWRYVALAPLKTWTPAAPRTVRGQEIDAHRLPGAASLVLIDGGMRGDLANWGAMPPEVAADDLMGLPADDAAALAARWQAELDAATDAPACWAIGDAVGGVRLRVRSAASRPIHLLSLASGGTTAARIVIELARGASLDLALSHVALAASRSTIAIEVELAEGARLRLDAAQYGPGAAASVVLPRLSARIARDATLSIASGQVGALLGRARVDAELSATGARLELTSLMVLDDTRQWHDLGRVAHRARDTSSTQRFKAIADGSAVTSADTLVRIDRGADGSDAAQRANALLLSQGARAAPRPQLDIHADEVKAGHGATIGQLVPEELFYLRSRGLSPAEARSLLVRGFALEALDSFALPAMRALVEREVLAGLVA